MLAGRSLIGWIVAFSVLFGLSQPVSAGGADRSFPSIHNHAGKTDAASDPDDRYERENDSAHQSGKLTEAQAEKLSRLYDKLFDVKKEIAEVRAEYGMISEEQKKRMMERLKLRIERLKLRHCLHDNGDDGE